MRVTNIRRGRIARIAVTAAVIVFVLYLIASWSGVDHHTVKDAYNARFAARLAGSDGRQADQPNHANVFPVLIEGALIVSRCSFRLCVIVAPLRGFPV